MRRPNILILYTDQQRWDAVGANGNADIQTPHLDALATSGVSFTRAFVQNAVCMPSRASFLTGQYPSTLRITQMGVPVPSETVTLPRLLKPYGYVSANIGKLHFQPHGNRDHRVPYPDYGFDWQEIADEPGPYEDAYRAWVRNRAPDQLDAITPGLPPAAEVWRQVMGAQETYAHPPERFPKHPIPFGGPDDLTYSAFVAEQTTVFIEENRGRHWLCVAAFYSPHSPWIVPQRFLDLYDRETFSLPPFPPELDVRRTAGHFDDAELRAARHGYYAMVSEVDYYVGRILAHLDTLGLAEDTIVVFTSDHGEWLGEHLKYGKGHPGHDAVTRVPLIVRHPGRASRAGQREDAIVEAVDVVPTLLEGAGVQIPPHLQGRSLVPLLAGEGDTGRDGAALVEHTGWKSLRSDRFRYAIEANGNEMLFDLTDDPLAYRNIVREAAAAPALTEMRGRLAHRLLTMERPLMPIWPY